MIKAVVFDLDGLLIDTEPLWYRAREELFEQYGLLWTDSDQQQCMGVSTAVWSGYMADRLERQMSPEEIAENIIDRMVGYYRAGEVDALPGAGHALTVGQNQYRQGLASGSPRRLVQAALEGMAWGHVFAEVLSGDDVAAGKPAPDIYLEITQRLAVSPHETIVVEDASSGIKAGYAAGTHVIAVPNPHLSPSPDVLAKAVVVLDSLEKFPEALSQLTSQPDDP